MTNLSIKSKKILNSHIKNCIDCGLEIAQNALVCPYCARLYKIMLEE